MKYAQLTKANQQLLEALEVAGSKKRKQRARHGKQMAADPKTKGTRSTAVSVWEFTVDPFTPGNGCAPGKFRLIRRSSGSEVTWYWAAHIGDTGQFNCDAITDIPSFKPVAETEEEDTAESATTHTDNVLERNETMTVATKEEVVPDSWEDV